MKEKTEEEVAKEQRVEKLLGQINKSNEKLKKNPTDSELHSDRAEYLVELAEKTGNRAYYDEAVKSYTEAIRLNPQDRLYLVDRSKLYVTLERPDLAAADIVKSQTMPKSGSESLNNLYDETAKYVLAASGVQYQIASGIKIAEMWRVHYAAHNNILIDETDPIEYAIARDIEILSQEPVQYAAHKKILIGGKDPIEYAIARGIKIIKMEPVQYAADHNIKITGKDPVEYAIEKGRYIGDKEPLEFAAHNNIKVAGNDPIEYALNKKPQMLLIGGEHPLKWAIDYGIPINGKPAIDYVINANIERVTKGEKPFTVAGFDPVHYAIDKAIPINGKTAIEYAIAENKRRLAKGEKPFTVSGFDPVQYAIDNKIKIEDKDPTIYAIDNGIKIAALDAIHYAAYYEIPINGKNAIDYAIDNNKPVTGIIPHEKKQEVLEKIIVQYLDATDQTEKEALKQRYAAVHELGRSPGTPPLLTIDSEFGKLVADPEKAAKMLANYKNEKGDSLGKPMLAGIDCTKCDLEVVAKCVQVHEKIDNARDYDNFSTIQKVGLAFASVVPIIGNAIAYKAMKSYDKSQQAKLGTQREKSLNPTELATLNRPKDVVHGSIKQIRRKLSEHRATKPAGLTPNKKGATNKERG